MTFVGLGEDKDFDGPGNGHFGTGSIGACLIANDLPGLGKEMLDRRVEGQSWKQIADDLHLGAPGTARKQFAKITGVTDFKTKGSAIRALAKQTGFLDEAGNVVAKNAAGKVAKGLSTKPPPLTKKAIPKQAQGWTGKHTGAASDYEGAAAKYSDNVRDQLIKMSDKGEGYTAISHATGVPIPEIDDFVWKRLLVKHDGDVWKAYLEKATSQSGGEAVKALILEGRSLGLTVDQISQLSGIPKTVVDAVVKNTWKIPTTAGSKAYIPDPPPPPAATYVADPNQLASLKPGDFKVRSVADMSKAMPNDLTSESYSAFRSYTGSGYSRINTSLRQQQATGRVNSTVKAIDDGMAPLPFDALVVRNSGADTFLDIGITKGTAPDLVGKVWSDSGFFSTSVRPGGVFRGQAFQMNIEVPKGTPCRWVGNGISSHTGEQELILARDTPMIITSVEIPPGGGTIIVNMRVL